MSKRILVIVAILVFFASISLPLFAGGTQEGAAAKPAKTYKIGAAVYGLRAEYMRLWTTALERHPDVVSGLVKITVFDGQYDASVQQSQFETMVTQGYDAILFVPIDIEAGAAAVAVANAAKIPVIGSNTRVNSDLLTSYIGSNDVLGGYMEAKSVIEGIGGKGNVVIIEGPIGQSAQIERREGNLKALAEYPNVKVLEMKTANWLRAEALSLMEDWLNAYPGKIDGVIGQNDEMALGAIQAIKQAGLNFGRLPHRRYRRRDGRHPGGQARRDGKHPAGRHRAGTGCPRSGPAGADRRKLQAEGRVLEERGMGADHPGHLQCPLGARDHGERRQAAGESGRTDHALKRPGR